MISYFKNLIDSLKRSLWFIPLVMTLFGLGLALLFNSLDWVFWERQLPYLGQNWGAESEGVRYLFANIGAAIITAMTTILSITLLIFTVLAGQYGAHVLRIFKLRTFSKFVIGWFSGTYMYMIYHVYTLTTDNGREYVPQFSIIIGMIFTIMTIFLLILYIHFLVRQIQVGTVVSEITEDLSKQIQSFPLLKADAAKSYAPKPQAAGAFYEEIGLSDSGYLQSIDKEALIAIALENRCSLKSLQRPGNHILTGEPILEVYSKQKIGEETVEKIRSAFIVGEKRIPVEDLECNLEILLELTVRALSPGVNDIVVANRCIDSIGETIAQLIKRELPDPYFFSDEGDLLLISHEFTFEGYLDSILNPIRQYSAEHCFVAIRLMDNLIKVLKMNRSSRYQSCLISHFHAIYEAALDKHPQMLDQKSLKERYELFLGTSSSEQVEK